MLNPKEIQIEDRELFLEHIGKQENSTLSFTTLFTWSFDGCIKYDVIDGCMVLVFDGKRGASCTVPYGKGDKLSATEKSYNYMLKKSNNPSFVLMNEAEASMLSGLYPDKFIMFSDENNADYVYLTEELINLKGNKFQQKRNHLNSFLKNFDYEYVKLTYDDVDEIKELFFKWYSSQKNHDLGASMKATMRFLDNLDKLYITSGGIRVDKKLIAYTAGEAITDDMAHVPMEFADVGFRGAFNIINRDFCMHEWKDYKYVNREEDMGVEGMRYAKQAYNPVKMIEKYKTVYKG